MLKAIPSEHALESFDHRRVFDQGTPVGRRISHRKALLEDPIGVIFAVVGFLAVLVIYRCLWSAGSYLSVSSAIWRDRRLLRCKDIGHSGRIPRNSDNDLRFGK
jgi:hypothetical protein